MRKLFCTAVKPVATNFENVIEVTYKNGDIFFYDLGVCKCTLEANIEQNCSCAEKLKKKLADQVGVEKFSAVSIDRFELLVETLHYVDDLEYHLKMYNETFDSGCFVHRNKSEMEEIDNDMEQYGAIFPIEVF